jgi:hypothetical protein
MVATSPDRYADRRRPASTCAWLFPRCQDRRQAKVAASCVDRAEGLLASCVVVRPYDRCHR